MKNRLFSTKSSEKCPEISHRKTLKKPVSTRKKSDAVYLMGLEGFALWPPLIISDALFRQVVPNGWIKDINR